MKKKLSFLVALALTLGLLTAPAYAAGMDNFQVSPTAPAFTDVSESEWYYDSVMLACKLGIMNGKEDGSFFDPLGQLTLGEAVTMAVRLHAIYWGNEFVPGGDPWYQNALVYAQDAGIITAGEYDDYTALATRADMAAMFAFALPAEEYDRVNAVTSIPDVTWETPYSDYIYQLYHAGILTGDQTGAFMPERSIDRASAAAIASRVAIPASRREISLDTPKEGEVTPATNGAFTFTLPEDWSTYVSEGCNYCRLRAISGDGSLSLAVYEHEKEVTLAEFAQAQAQKRVDNGGALLVSPHASRPRGYIGGEFSYLRSDGAIGWVCIVENSGCYYAVDIVRAQGTTDEVWADMQAIFDSFVLTL